MIDFNNKFSVKRVVLCLLGVALVSYGIAALIFFSFGNFSFIKNNKSGNHGLFQLASDSYDFHASKSMDLDGIDEISINFYSGDIKFNNEGTNNVKVKVDGEITSSGAYAKPELKCYKEGKTLYVELTKKHMGFFLNYSSDITANISIPTSYKNSLKVVSSAGDVNIGGYEFKNLDCNLSAGKLQMQNISADTFKYKNSAGNLNADNLKTRSSSFRASAGKIEITKFAGDIEGSNSAGNTEIQYDKFNNNVDFSASAGRIKLTLPKDSAFKLDAEASAGSIKNDFSGINVNGEFGEKTAKGEVGKSNNMIQLKDSAGSIEVNNY